MVAYGDVWRQVRIAAENGVPPLVAALRSTDPKIHEHVLVTLRNISANQDNKVRIVQEGAVPALVFLLNSTEKLIQQLAAGVLRNLARYSLSLPPKPCQVLTLLALLVQNS
jgi:hypothetical protein